MIKADIPRFLYGHVASMVLLLCVSPVLLFNGCGSGTPGNSGGSGPPSNPAPTVSITANPASIAAGSSSTLTVTVTNATQVTLTGSDGSSYTLQVAAGRRGVQSQWNVYRARAWAKKQLRG